MLAGNAFNAERRPSYPQNEVRLDNGKVVDSYVPGQEIVERKFSQLGEIKPETAQGYVRSLDKYPPGQIVADTSANRASRPELVGKALTGRQVLEVRVQRTPIPKSILDFAAERGVIIRDVNGKVY